MGIDAPELGRCGSQEAKNQLSMLIAGEKVKLSEEVTENYGRTMALVYEGDNFINKIMMESGWGRPDYRKNSRRDELTAAYHLAQKDKVGIYGMCVDIQSSDNPDCLIKANIDPATSDKFYHLPGCFYYDDVKIDTDRGEKFFCTEKEAQEAGFRLASGCP